MNKKILILGYGLSGKALAQFFFDQKALLSIFDDQKKVLDHKFQNSYFRGDQINLKQFDFIACSPGISRNHPIYQRAVEQNVPIYSEIEIGVRHLQNMCIGVTGTNGKSTVTSMITHVLNQSRRPAVALGNIGKPLVSHLKDLKDEILVLELSSYQIDALSKPFLEAAVLLNISEDHLDRYITMKRYANSKFRLFKLLNDKKPFFYQKKLRQDYPGHIQHLKMFFFDEAFNVMLKSLDQSSPQYEYFKSLSIYEQQNISAVISICNHLKVSMPEIARAVMTFQGLTHRLEKVRDYNQISFINDSKATNQESVIRAVCSIKEPIRIIMGGQDKKLSFKMLKPYFYKKVQKIYAIGEIREMLKKEFQDCFRVECFNSLEQAVKKAYVESSPGDVVLLSPATASFDMFKNFEERGNAFKKCVNHLEGVK